MKRIIGFDAGTKRIGVAVSDETGLIASPVGYLDNDDNLEVKIGELVEKYQPGEIVIGNPVSMDGVSRKKEFIESFREKVGMQAENIVISMWDERLSSVQAEKILIKGNVRRKDRKKHIDKVAAVITLQNYLDYLRSRKRNE